MSAVFGQHPQMPPLPPPQGPVPGGPMPMQPPMPQGPMPDMMPPEMMPPEMMAAMAAPPMLHDVKIVRKTKRGRARVMTVPPEEFKISRRAKLGAMQEVDYCAHETTRTATDLIEDGFDAASVDSLPTSDFDDTEEAIARDTVDDRTSGTGGASNLNEATKQVRVTEHYVRMRYEGDKAKLYRVTTAGKSTTILHRGKKPAIEHVEEIPFASMTPYIMTHRFFGLSAADMVMDIARIKTAILRSLLDNMYFANNQRTEIAEEFANKHTIDDWITNRPGGMVRTKRPGGLIPIANSGIGEFAYPLLEYWDNVREWRTGVTRQGQGIGSDSLKNVGEEALLSMMNAAQGRMRLIARIFAETGVRDMFLLLHAITRRNATKADTVRLRKQWVEIDPSQWRRRDDMTVSVGLGSGSKGQQVSFLMNLLGLQKEALAAGGIGGMVKPKHIYNTVKRLVEASGFRSVDPFADNPEDPENQQQDGETPPDPKLLEAQGKIQLQANESEQKAKTDEARLMMDKQAGDLKHQADGQRMLMEHQARIAQIESDAQLKREQMLAEMQLKREQMNAEMQLKREQMTMEAQVGFGSALVAGAVKEQSAGISDVRMGGEVG